MLKLPRYALICCADYVSVRTCFIVDLIQMTISSHSTKEKISLNKQQIEAGACREILGGNMLIFLTRGN